MKPVATTIAHTSDSTDRTPALANPKGQTKPAATQVGTARRILNALMRSLATPHV